MKTKLQFRSLVNHSPNEVFNWHLRPRLLERCTPPYEKIEVICSEGRPSKIGSRFSIRAKILGLFWSRQIYEYTSFVENERFSLVQKEGAFDEFHYKTRITPQSSHTTEIIDQFEFSLKYPHFFPSLITKRLKKRVGRILAYKHQLIDHDIGMIKKYPFKKPLKILISGSHGLIGKNLGYFFEFIGHDVWHLSRKDLDEEKTIYWNPKTGECNLGDFEGFDVIIHLAGENISKGWWTKKKKEKVLESRHKGTERLASIIKGLKRPPKTFMCASAVGYYGNRGNEVLSEKSPPGRGLFISEVCEKWEQASKELEEAVERVVHTRFGVVLSSAGGALKKLLFPFKFGLGGKLGNGHQYVSWVAIDDVIGALYHVMMTPSIDGPVNVVSPNPVQSGVLTKKLAKRLNRWMGPPLPEFVIRMVMGQKGEELLLSSARVEPKRLADTGYVFHYPKLCQTFEHVI